MSIRKSFNVRNKSVLVIISGVVVGVAAYYYFAITFLFFLVGWLFFIPTFGFVYMVVLGLQEFRTVTRNISLDKESIEKLKPCLKKHKGNFSAAIRDVISHTTKSSSFRNLESIDNFLFKWMVNEIDGLLLPDNILDEIINPCFISSMANLESFLNNKFRELEWDIDIVLEYDSNTSPSNILIKIRGQSQQIRFIASLISQFLVKNSINNIPLKIKSTVNSDKFMRVELSSSNKKEAIDSLVNFFGSNDVIIKTIKSNPAFWKSMFDTHISNNYNMVTVHRNYFEELFADKVPSGEITIENIARKPIREIPLEEMFSLIKQVYEASRIIDRVEIYNENLTLFHSYRNKDAIEKLKESFILLLEANGHKYNAKSTANMIILTNQQKEKDFDVLNKSSTRFESGNNADFC